MMNKEVQYRLESIEKLLGLVDGEPKTTCLSFGEALKFAINGEKIGCWHRDDIYVNVVRPSAPMHRPYLQVKTIEGEFAPWSPNNREIFANNWRVIED